MDVLNRDPNTFNRFTTCICINTTIQQYNLSSRMCTLEIIATTDMFFGFPILIAHQRWQIENNKAIGLDS
ncbi:MAG: hypothetical protein AB1798_01000 [Spirochaetota bacterium]